MMEHNFLLYFSILLVSYILTKKILRKFQNLPPSPFPTLPIIGHLHLLKAQPGRLHRALAKVSARYGPVVRLKLGSRDAILVSAASAAEDCLHHNDVIFANRPRLVGAKILGYNYTTILWAPYGPLWRKHRRLASTEILSPHRLNLLSNIRAEEVKSLIKKVDQMIKGDQDQDQTVVIKPALFEMTNNVMLRMIAGKRFYGEESENNDEAQRFKLLVKELLDLGGAFNIQDFLPFLKYLGFTGKLKECKDIFVKLDKFFQNIVDEHRRKMGSEENQDLNGKNKSMLEVMLQLRDSDPSYFTDDIIKGMVLMLLLAGTETSSSTMEWAIALLLNHPKVLHKAQKEIDEHVGRDRLIEESDLAHLPYLHCIINETLRMYPAAPVVPPHESSDDCIVGGYRVRRGTMLFLNIWAIHNDPKVWDEPWSFKPERFESHKGDRGYKFMPFGSGRRACPGENLATRVVGLVLGSLLQCFDWERVGEELVDMEETFGVSMWKANPLHAKCRPREHMINLISAL